jgi:outer membrane protein assembly factor BamB
MTRKLGWMVSCCLLLSLVGSKGAFGAEEVVAAAGILAEQPGICLDLGCGDGKRAAGIASETGMFVFALAKDEKDCEAARETLERAGLYGTRATVMTGSLDKLPFPKGYGNLVVVGDFTQGVNLKEVGRVLNRNGVAVVGGAKVGKAGLETALKRAGIADYKLAGDYAIIRGRMPEGSDDWTHFKHGPENNPVSSETTIRPPFRTQWVAGEPGHSGAINPAVIAQGRVILSDVGEGYRRPPLLWAWDSFNGTLLWKRELKLFNQFHGLVMVKDIVYTLDEDKILVLDAATGREIRTLEVSNGDQPVGRYLRLAVVDGVLYLQTQGSAEIKKYTIAGDGPMGELFFALSLKDGGLLWKYRSPAPGLTYSVVLGGGALYYYAPDVGVIAVDLKTGRELWKNTEFAGALKVERYDNHNWATYHDGLVYFFTTKTVALDARTGKVQWNKPGVAPRGLMFIGDKVYTHLKFGKSIKMFDPRTGGALGEIPCYLPGCGMGTGSTSGIYSAGQGFGVYDFATKKRFVYDVFRVSCGTGIIPANGLIFEMPFACGCAYPIVGPAALAPAAGWTIPEGRQDLDKRLLRGPAFDAAAPADEQAKKDWPCYRANPGHTAVTGNAPKLPLAMGWQQKLFGTLTPPSTGGGLVYVGSSDGHVWGLDEADGSVRWKFTCGGSVPVTPAYSQGRVLFGSRDGWVYALGGGHRQTRLEVPCGAGGALRQPAGEDGLHLAGADGSGG